MWVILIITLLVVAFDKTGFCLDEKLEDLLYVKDDNKSKEKKDKKSKEDNKAEEEMEFTETEQPKETSKQNNNEPKRTAPKQKIKPQPQQTVKQEPSCKSVEEDATDLLDNILKGVSIEDE